VFRDEVLRDDFLIIQRFGLALSFTEKKFRNLEIRMELV
jgi:hypothetical protein